MKTLRKMQTLRDVYDISRFRSQYTFQQWQKIVKCYLRQIWLYIFDGGVFDIPHRLGTMEIHRKLSTRFPDYKRGKEQNKLVIRRNHELDNWTPSIRWKRGKTPPRLMEFFRIHIPRRLYKKVYQTLKNQRQGVYKFNQSVSSTRRLKDKNGNSIYGQVRTS